MLRSLFVCALPMLALPFAACQGGPPQSLDAMESASEDAYDHALAGNASAVSKDMATLERSWTSFRSKAVRRGASDATISDVDAVIGELQHSIDTGVTGVALARAANAVSGKMEELYALYNPAIPPSILTLDYGGREVYLDAMERNLGAAMTDVSALGATWARVEPEIRAHGGDLQANDYATSLAEMRERVAAGDTEGLRREAGMNLERVDGLERVFEK